MSKEKQVLYGCETAHALDNFPLSGRVFNRSLGHAYGQVKLACLKTNHDLQYVSQEKFIPIERACLELIAGKLDQHLVVDALQGGAGTATNFNINEVIANRALQLSGRQPGEHQYIHPLNDVNLHQSTNDTYPTALKVAALRGLIRMEKSLISLLNGFQAKEQEYSQIVKTGRTQLRDAVLTTMGRTMSAFAEAVSRDRWRIYKSLERIRVVNLGGTAIGTGLGAPKQYIFAVTEQLKNITGFALARAENMVDCTQNLDVFAEVSGFLRTCGVNLYKINQDFRLMASGPLSGFDELILKKRQLGSTIMAGKVNPVIPEAVIQCSMLIDGNDSIISRACGEGNLELNAFLPLIAEKFLESIEVLNAAIMVMDRFVRNDLIVNKETCRRQIENTTALAGAFVKELGYTKVEEILIRADKKKILLKDAFIEAGISEERYLELTSAEAVVKLGD
jgi:aspartate ammonia-lyase